MKKVVLQGLTWTESYNCYHTVINDWFGLDFVWENDSYKVTVGGVTLRYRPKCFEHAAEFAVNAARIRLQKVLEGLPHA